MERVPTGFLKIHAAGAEVYIEDLKVEKDEQVNIPADEPMTITVINPINGLTKDHVVTIKKDQTKTLFFTPPTGN